MNIATWLETDSDPNVEAEVRAKLGDLLGSTASSRSSVRRCRIFPPSFVPMDSVLLMKAAARS
ncbi:MAG TPA: hypothetical protein VGO47_04850 [Chlamydiales bacterium]|nr:hypothetical protein [Chlamydiales bacterium]